MDKTMKLTVGDIEVEVKMSEEDFAKLSKAKEPKRTGYERAEKKAPYYHSNSYNFVSALYDDRDSSDATLYNSANYYTDKTLAENNARADMLMRQLRRFAAENCEEVKWDGNCHCHWYIYYNCTSKKIDIDETTNCKRFGVIHFDTEENAQKAIDTFKDELMWYFTEYRDRV